MTALLLGLVAFVAMEPTAALLHRRVMHRGRGRAWHASHHRPERRPNRDSTHEWRGFERNDLYPVVFAMATTATIALGSSVAGLQSLLWVGFGISAYGLAYLVVHDVYIHARLGVRPGSGTRYIMWVRRCHEAHHATGQAPFGFLLPCRGRNNARKPSRPAHG